MTTKQWLKQARGIDREINALMEARQQELSRLLSVTAKLSSDPVSGSKDPHKFDRIAELDELINRKIDDLVSVKAEIINGIYRLRDGRYRTILLEYYVNMKTFAQIAEDMGKSERHITRLHGHALIALGGVYAKEIKAEALQV